MVADVSLPCTVTNLSCTLTSAFCPRVTFAPEAARRAAMLAPLRPITKPPAVRGMSKRCERETEREEHNTAGVTVAASGLEVG